MLVHVLILCCRHTLLMHQVVQNVAHCAYAEMEIASCAKPVVELLGALDRRVIKDLANDVNVL